MICRYCNEDKPPEKMRLNASGTKRITCCNSCKYRRAIPRIERDKAKNRPYFAEWQRAYRKKTRVLTFEKYGGCICCWCGEVDLDVLQIDHINNDGADHRRAMRPNQKNTHGEGAGAGGHYFYQWLKKHKYPAGFQVLCANCNIAKVRNGGILPQNRKNLHREQLVS